MSRVLPTSDSIEEEEPLGVAWDIMQGLGSPLGLGGVERGEVVWRAIESVLTSGCISRYDITPLSSWPAFLLLCGSLSSPLAHILCASVYLGPFCVSLEQTALSHLSRFLVDK